MIKENSPFFPAISVIIPVYNVEKYLRKTLSSVAKQTMKNFEVIMIDDGSTDSSLEIANEFCEKYDNFRLINLENGGVSKARNAGIDASKGEYIAFIDSDDFVSQDFLELLYKSAKSSDADVVCCNYLFYFSPSGKIFPEIFNVRSGIYSGKKLLNTLIKDFRMHYYVWNKLWKRTLFTENNIRFPEMFFEDIVLSSQLFYYADKVVVINKSLYYYVRHRGSMMTCIGADKFNDYIKSIGCMRNFFEYNNDYTRYKLSLRLYGYRVMLTNVKLLFNICLVRKNFKGFFSDLRRANSMISYYLGNKFEFKEDFLNIKEFILRG